LTSSEGLWRAGVTLRTGFAEYAAANPVRIVATTALPRAVLQSLFFTLLGRVTAGEDGARFAFVGSIAVVMALSTMVGICDVPMLEKWSGTSYRLQLGVQRPVVTFLLRSAPWLVEALVAMLVCLAVVGPVTGHAAVSLALLPAVPIYVLMAATSAAAGCTVASLAIGRRADVLVGNAFVYLVIAAGGVLVPPGRLGWLDAVGTILPIRNGLLAVHALLGGGAWAGHVLAEAGVGAAWAALAWVAYGSQFARARRLGTDDYA
jgi:ABC-2 type transport system permease protein